jgi:hypothetical protein
MRLPDLSQKDYRLAKSVFSTAWLGGWQPGIPDLKPAERIEESECV